MTIDNLGIKLLAECEGLRLKSYQCPAKKWTIGLGNTFYPDGEPVKQGDIITPAKAYELFHLIAKQFENGINNSVSVELSQPQFNALFIFAYNIGVHGFKGSTLLKRVNLKCGDKLIEEAFLMWKGEKDTLLSRRQKEFKEWQRK